MDGEGACIFCRIVSGEIPSLKIYEDANVVSFLDIDPCSPGHAVVIPRKHYRILSEMPDDEAGVLFATATKIAKSIQAAMDAQGYNIGANVDKAAGQAVPHVHIHVIPRYEGDKGGAIQHIVRMEVNKEQLAQHADKIRSALSSGAAAAGPREVKTAAPERPAEAKKKKPPKWYYFEE